MPLTDDELKRIEAYCEKATQGPWQQDGAEEDRNGDPLEEYWSYSTIWSEGGDLILEPKLLVEPDGSIVCRLGNDVGEGRPFANGLEFMCKARTDLLRAISEIRRLRTIVKDLHV